MITENDLFMAIMKMMNSNKLPLKAGILAAVTMTREKSVPRENLAASKTVPAGIS